MPKDGEDKRYLVIVNPVSRGGKAQEEGIWLLNRLKKAGVDYEFLFTERAGHAEEMVVKWAEDFDVVVSVSGDGTTNEIINGIMKVPSADLRLAMFPAGTADDFACNMGYDRKDKEQALEAILGNTCRTIDLIRYDDHYAAVTWGLGVDSEIADGAYKWKRFRIPAYFYSGLKKCFFEERKKYDVRFDYEGQIFEGKVLISILCNAPVFGRYIRINPNARMNDGLLDLTVGREMPNVYGLVLFAFACLGEARLLQAGLLSPGAGDARRVQVRHLRPDRRRGLQVRGGKDHQPLGCQGGPESPRARRVSGRQEAALRVQGGAAGAGPAAPHPQEGRGGGGTGGAVPQGEGKGGEGPGDEADGACGAQEPGGTAGPAAGAVLAGMGGETQRAPGRQEDEEGDAQAGEDGEACQVGRMIYVNIIAG